MNQYCTTVETDSNLYILKIEPKTVVKKIKSFKYYCINDYVEIVIGIPIYFNQILVIKNS